MKNSINRRGLYRWLALAAVLVVFSTGCASPPPPQPEPAAAPVKQVAPEDLFDTSMTALVAQIGASFSDQATVKLAVFDFVDLQGKTSEMGMFVSEELITRLFQTGRFDVVERKLLGKILAEQKLSMSGLIEEQSVQTIGRILGVKAIVTGTITDLETTVRLNARIINAETGKLAAAAGITIAKTADVVMLLGKYKAGPDLASLAGIEATSTTTSTVANPSVVYEEDFTGIDDGLVPKHWAGAQHVLVKTIGRNKYLCPFEKGEYKIVIPELNIPWGDFKIEWLCHYSPKNYSTAGETEFTITIGNVCAGIAYTTWGSKGVWINGTQEKFGDVNDKVFLMCLEKRGDVWRLFIDGTQSILARVQSFQRSNTIVLDFKDHPFYLSWIRVLALEG